MCATRGNVYYPEAVGEGERDGWWQRVAPTHLSIHRKDYGLVGYIPYLDFVLFRESMCCVKLEGGEIKAEV